MLYADQAGFGVAQDLRVDAKYRFVVLLSPGSSCSITLTIGYIEVQPGTSLGLVLLLRRPGRQYMVSSWLAAINIGTVMLRLDQ